MTRNLRSSFSEGKAGTDFGLRTVLCHLLQITIEQSGRTTTRRKRWGCSGTSLPASPGWSRGCPVTAFGTSSPLLCHKHSSRIRKLNTLTVIIQYLNHLHISLVISAQIYFCRNTLNGDKQRNSRLRCSHVQCCVGPLVSSSLPNANLLSGVGEEIQETQSGGAACEDWGVWRDLFITSLTGTGALQVRSNWSFKFR